MSVPYAIALSPTNLTFSTAMIHGKCIITGGVPTKISFGFDGYPPHFYQRTPWWNVPADGYIQSYRLTGLSYATKHSFFVIINNAYGEAYSFNCTFWLPRPNQPEEGSPFLILAGAGTFDNGTYTFRCTSDVACSLYALVGLRKPYVFPEIHWSEGVAFRHEPRLVFNWISMIFQEETGDSVYHTFIIPYAYLDVTYWFVLLGTVDGKISPSISPFFNFRRLSLASLKCNPAFSITDTEAYIGGKLLDDKGAGVYLRLRWTKVEDYTDYTAIDGPHRSFWQITEKITGLDPDTLYKTSIIGSHDKDMIRYSWSQPCYFKTQIYSTWHSYPKHYLWTSLYFRYDPVWLTTWARTSGSVYINPSASAYFDIQHDGTYYRVYRFAMSFDTSSIPSGATIIDAYLRVQLTSLYSAGRDFNFSLQSGFPTYPHEPAISSDYNKNHYSGQAVWQTLDQSSSIDWHDIYFTPFGLSCINKGGISKFIARVSTDVSGLQPPNNSKEGFYLHLVQFWVKWG